MVWWFFLSALCMPITACSFLCSYLKPVRSAALTIFLPLNSFLLQKIFTDQAVNFLRLTPPNLISPIMPPPVVVWDPKNDLEIGQVLLGVTRVGYAKTKRRRCRTPIARASYQRATLLLLQMSRMNVSEPGVDNALAHPRTPPYLPPLESSEPGWGGGAI